jgi:Type IV secretion system pilin
MLYSLLFKISSIYEDVGLPNGDASNLVENVKNLVFVIAAVVALFFLVTAGLSYVTSGGNADKTKKAGQTIIFASVGLFIILMSYTIITWVFKIGTS